MTEINIETGSGRTNRELRIEAAAAIASTRDKYEPIQYFLAALSEDYKDVAGLISASRGSVPRVDFDRINFTLTQLQLVAEADVARYQDSTRIEIYFINHSNLRLTKTKGIFIAFQDQLKDARLPQAVAQDVEKILYFLTELFQNELFLVQKFTRIRNAELASTLEF